MSEHILMRAEFLCILLILHGKECCQHTTNSEYSVVPIQIPTVDIRYYPPIFYPGIYVLNSDSVVRNGSIHLLLLRGERYFPSCQRMPSPLGRIDDSVATLVPPVSQTVLIFVS